MISPASALSNCDAGISTYLLTRKIAVNCSRIDRTFSFSASARMSFALAERTSGTGEREWRGTRRRTVEVGEAYESNEEFGMRIRSVQRVWVRIPNSSFILGMSLAPDSVFRPD